MHMFDEHFTIIISYALNLQNNAFSNKTQLIVIFMYFSCSEKHKCDDLEWET